MTGTPRHYLGEVFDSLDPSSGIRDVAARFVHVLGALEADEVAEVTALISRAAQLGADVRRVADRLRMGQAPEGRAR